MSANPWMRRDEMAEKRTEQFGQPLARIMRDTSISIPARLAYCLMTYDTFKKNGSVCRMSVTRIARELGIERKNASKYVKELEAKGVVVRLTKNTQPAQWRVPTGGIFEGNSSRHRDKSETNSSHNKDKFGGNSSRHRGKNSSRWRDTYHKEHKSSEFDLSEGQGKILQDAQERLVAKRAKLQKTDV